MGRGGWAGWKEQREREKTSDWAWESGKGVRHTEKGQSTQRASEEPALRGERGEGKGGKKGGGD